MNTVEPFRRTFLELPQGRLAVVTAGERGAPVLLLTGGGADNALISWRHLLPDLAADHRVLALDWPHRGHSTPWSGSADHQALVEVVRQVLDHFAVDRVALVGLSQGATVALAQAAAHPDRVERVVALAPGGIAPYPPLMHQLLWLVARSRLLHTTVPTRMVHNPDRVALMVRRALLAGPVADFDEMVQEMFQEIRAHGAGPSEWQNTAINAWGTNQGVRFRLEEIACPVLFLQGDKDNIVRPLQTVEAYRRVPRARLRMLRDQGHLANRQSPGLVNGLVREFLTEAAPAAGPGTHQEGSG